MSRHIWVLHRGSCSCRRVIDLLYSDGKAGNGWVSQKEAAGGERWFDEARLTAACRQSFTVSQISLPSLSSLSETVILVPPLLLSSLFSFIYFFYFCSVHLVPFPTLFIFSLRFYTPPLRQLCQLLASVVLLLLKRTRFCHWCFSLSPPKKIQFVVWAVGFSFFLGHNERWSRGHGSSVLFWESGLPLNLWLDPSRGCCFSPEHSIHSKIQTNPPPFPPPALTVPYKNLIQTFVPFFSVKLSSPLCQMCFLSGSQNRKHKIIIVFVF